MRASIIIMPNARVFGMRARSQNTPDKRKLLSISYSHLFLTSISQVYFLNLICWLWYFTSGYINCFHTCGHQSNLSPQSTTSSFLFPSIKSTILRESSKSNSSHRCTTRWTSWRLSSSVSSYFHSPIQTVVFIILRNITFSLQYTKIIKCSTLQLSYHIPLTPLIIRVGTLAKHDPDTLLSFRPPEFP